MRIYKLFDKEKNLVGVISCSPDIIADVAEKLGADSISIPHLTKTAREALIEGYNKMRGVV